MAKVAVYVLQTNGQAKMVVPKMAEGAKAVGDIVTFMRDTDYVPEHAKTYDTAIFWGYIETLQVVMKGFVEAGKSVVYLDLAYWHRGTHYKVAVNARHPTAYFQAVEHDATRRLRFDVHPKTYKQQPADAPVLVAGLSQKAAWAEKEGPWGQYEERAVEELRRHTKRPIIYRAKTRKANAQPIPGTQFSNLEAPLMPLLTKSWAVVTRHSNVVVDGLVEGIPGFAWYGVGKPMSLQDLSKIEQPIYPGDREQWLNDIAYCQWSLDEMKSGAAWRHLKNESLIK